MADDSLKTRAQALLSESPRRAGWGMMAAALIRDLLHRVRVLGDEASERGQTLGRYRAALEKIAAGPWDEPSAEPWSKAEALIALQGSSNGSSAAPEGGTP